MERILFFVLFLLLNTNNSFASFSDVLNTHENKEAIDYMEKSGIIKGYPDGYFEPRQSINRAEFLKIVLESNLDFSIEIANQCIVNLQSKFTKPITYVYLNDVPVNEWFAPYVCYAIERNIIEGYGDNTFKPTKKILLPELSKIIVNTQNLIVNEQKTGEEWYEPFIIALEEKKAIPITIETLDCTINRGEVAEILFRIMNNRTDKLSNSLEKINIYIQDHMTDVMDKPVIYLYPKITTQIKVQLDYQGELIADYPDYNEDIKGWEVLAYPDGKLINLADKQEYSYLFWEGVASKPSNWDLSQGFVVKGEDTKKFLQTVLPKIGLTPKEYNEFIVYWYPLMKDNKYNLIHFAEEEYTKTAPLTITPPPDSMLRVFMVFKALNKPVIITEPKIKPFARTGFSVVEWGGTEIN